MMPRYLHTYSSQVCNIGSSYKLNKLLIIIKMLDALLKNKHNNENYYQQEKHYD